MLSQFGRCLPWQSQYSTWVDQGFSSFRLDMRFYAHRWVIWVIAPGTGYASLKYGSGHLEADHTGVLA